MSARVSGGTIYLNFGRHWTRDFSIVVPRRLRADFAAGVAPESLQGRRIRVFGFIEQRLGPTSETDAPGQIELAGDGTRQSRKTRP